jgi:hypothetical protein
VVDDLLSPTLGSITASALRQSTWRLTPMLRSASALSCGILLVAASASMAVTLDTVNWAADTKVDGMGTGMLGGSNTVSYFTTVGFNAGEESINNLWATNLGTAAATGGSVSFQTGGILGGPVSAAPATQVITFSSTVVKPILLVDFLGGPGATGGVFANDSFDFGTNGFTVLSSHNATALGNIVSSTTAVTDSADDGFGIQFVGTFGSKTPLQFRYTSDGLGSDALQTVAFTVGVPVPEPTSASVLLSGIIGVALLRRHRITRLKGR